MTAYAIRTTEYCLDLSDIDHENGFMIVEFGTEEGRDAWCAGEDGYQIGGHGG